ncbi:hypothetical protein VP01_2497g1 [Puccinia sorghi]|uniref:Uncharacterized protein n=1 Tax=Puccinia sorghi TaxID=27349 RepID=A0A0L6V5M1_9BASI|nr:hypothetical protein VP01_2497g1 [Puccinia sorghi]
MPKIPRVIRNKFLNKIKRHQINPFTTKYLIYGGFWEEMIPTEGGAGLVATKLQGGEIGKGVVLNILGISGSKKASFYILEFPSRSYKSILFYFSILTSNYAIMVSYYIIMVSSFGVLQFIICPHDIRLHLWESLILKVTGNVEFNCNLIKYFSTLQGLNNVKTLLILYLWFTAHSTSYFIIFLVSFAYSGVSLRMAQVLLNPWSYMKKLQYFIFIVYPFLFGVNIFFLSQLYTITHTYIEFGSSHKLQDVLLAFFIICGDGLIFYHKFLRFFFQENKNGSVGHFNQQRSSCQSGCLFLIQIWPFFLDFWGFHFTKFRGGYPNQAYPPTISRYQPQTPTYQLQLTQKTSKWTTDPKIHLHLIRHN